MMGIKIHVNNLHHFLLPPPPTTLSLPGTLSGTAAVDLARDQMKRHTPNIAFRQLPLNLAIIAGHATERALSTSAQLSTDAVGALRKVWVVRRLCKQHRVQAHT